MRVTVVAVLAVAAAATAGAAAPGADLASPRETSQLPLVFEQNAGQAKPPVRFVARGARFRLFLMRTAAVMSFGQMPGKPQRSGLLKLRFGQAAARPRLVGVGRPAGRVSLVARPRRVSARTYRAVAYRDLYTGVDLVFDGSSGRLEYRFVLARGADPRRISLAFGGVTSKRLLQSGDLLLRLRRGSLRVTKPVAYQQVAGRKRAVAVRYLVTPHGDVRFRLGRYDSKRALVIDPELVYGATLLGEGAGSFANGVAVDGEGNAHVAGYLARAEFPAETDDYAAPPRNGQGFVTKLGEDGVPLYTAYFDGPGDDFASDVAVDDDGRAYVAGTSDFETPRSDAFVTKLDRDGTPLWTATLAGGGLDEATAIAVDPEGAAYVTGRTASADFPADSHGLPRNPGGMDVFVAKLSSRGDRVWATAFGGGGDNDARGIDVDATGAAYVAGATDTGYSQLEVAPKFPTTPGSFQPEGGGGFDAFVAKLAPDGSRLVYSTLLGGDNTQRAYAVAVDGLGRASVTGGTAVEFPTTPEAFQRVPDPYTTTFDAFVARLDVTGSRLEHSTLLGGDLDEVGSGIGVDAAGRTWVTGWTWSSNFPAKADGPQSEYAGAGDAFVSAFEPDGELVYSSYLGGAAQEQGNAIAVGSDGSAYPAGITLSTDFEGALRNGYDPVWAAYVLRLRP